MRIAFVTVYDAQDVNNWSGTPFYMSKAFIDAGVKVDFIGNLKNSPNYLSSKIKNKLYNDLLQKRFGTYYRFYEPKNLKYIAAQVQKIIENSDVDLVLSPGAIPIAYLNTTKPIVMWSDATFAAMRDYYPGYSDYNRLSIKNCNQYEKNIFKRAMLSCFSSDWAAESAIRYYNADHKKIKTVPYGANLFCKRRPDDIVEMNINKSRATCNLLFVGQEWDRKGAPTAISIAEELNFKGLKTVLHLVGLKKIPFQKLPEFVINHGFINKATPEGINKIDSLFSQSHFFVLPTKADCSPMVFAEANSFGLPVITCNTGGIPSLIKDNVNGKMFDINMNIDNCVEYIEGLYKNFDNYCRLSLSSFNEYKTTLNWEKSIAKMITHIDKMLSAQ